MPFIFRTALKALLSVTPETRTRDLLQGCAVHSQANPIATETKHQGDRNKLVEIRGNPAGLPRRCGPPDLAYGCLHGGPRVSVSTRDSSSAAPPQPWPTARAGPAARTPQQAGARALPSSARPAPGTGLESRAALGEAAGRPEPRPQRAVGRVSRLATHLPPLGPPGASRRSPCQSGLSRRHQQWPGLHLLLLAVPGTEGRPPCHVCPSPSPAASRGSVVPMVQGKGRAVAQVMV